MCQQHPFLYRLHQNNAIQVYATTKLCFGFVLCVYACVCGKIYTLIMFMWVKKTLGFNGWR